MTLEKGFKARLDEIRSAPKRWQGGRRVFHRDDDVVFALAVADSINTPEHPALFDDATFWVYSSDSGTWGKLDAAQVLRAVMGLSGERVFKKMVQKKNDTTGVMEDVMETYPLDMSGSRCKSIASLVETLLSEPHSFHSAMSGLAFRNGFAVPTAEGVKVRPKSPSWRARTAIDFAWRDYPAPLWFEFLDDVFRDDYDREEKKLFLQEFSGLALVGGSIYHEKCAFLYGLGSNGKSIFLDTLQSIFPRESRSAIPPQQWDNEYYRARLDGIALNVVSELPPKDILDSQAVKAIISGEEIEGRRPKENPFMFRPKAAHVFAVNPPLPAVADLSDGFWRRIVAVTFNRSFAEGSPERKDKRTYLAQLAAERCGIVTWAMKGAVRVYKQGGYTKVPSSEKFLTSWRTASDQVAMFVSESCYRTTEVKRMMTNEELYRAFRYWGERTGHRMLVSMSRFAERLTLLGIHEQVDGAQRVRPLATVAPTDPSDSGRPTPTDPREVRERPEQTSLFSGARGPRQRGPGSGPAPA